jgi:hypothetical protein
VTQALRACVTAAASLVVRTAFTASSALAVTSCVKLQCVVMYQVWLKPAGNTPFTLSSGLSRKRLVGIRPEFESSPYWGLIHFWGAPRIAGSPEPVFFICPEILGDKL